MSLKTRIIPCLDVKDGRTVKGVNFVDLKDAGDPVALAKAYDLIYSAIFCSHCLVQRRLDTQMGTFGTQKRPFGCQAPLPALPPPQDIFHAKSPGYWQKPMF